MHLLQLNTPHLEKIKRGYPWIFRRDLVKMPELAPGCLVRVAEKGQLKPFALGYFHPTSQIAVRLLSWSPKESLDKAFFMHKFEKALALRTRLFNTPYYRLVHAEADGLPGLIIDRFDDTLICQTATVGMELLKAYWYPALLELIKPTNVIFRDDVPARNKEGLPLEVTIPLGETPIPLWVEEHEIWYQASASGQKTGWFYDQRANHLWMSKHAKGKQVLDLFTYGGGFGIAAAVRGAEHVTFVDSSADALALAKASAIKNNVLERCSFIKSDVFDYLSQTQLSGETFDIVIADPPAFVKELRHKHSGLKGYEKLAKNCSYLVNNNVILLMASCSHHASTFDFKVSVEAGIRKAEKNATLIYRSGADKDHPIHPLLPQTHYLKALGYRFAK